LLRNISRLAGPGFRPCLTMPRGMFVAFSDVNPGN
jgi:hypothetical protein